MALIDITDLVEKARSTFVVWGVNTTYAYLIAPPPVGAGLSFLAWPIVNTFVKSSIEFVLNYLSNQTVMAAFFMNTAIAKASQAEDYLAAVNAKDALPESATDAEYKKAEELEMQTFNAFVRVAS